MSENTTETLDAVIRKRAIDKYEEEQMKRYSLAILDRSHPLGDNRFIYVKLPEWMREPGRVLNVSQLIQLIVASVVAERSQQIGDDAVKEFMGKVDKLQSEIAELQASAAALTR